MSGKTVVKIESLVQRVSYISIGVGLTYRKDYSLIGGLFMKTDTVKDICLNNGVTVTCPHHSDKVYPMSITLDAKWA